MHRGTAIVVLPIINRRPSVLQSHRKLNSISGDSNSAGLTIMSRQTLSVAPSSFSLIYRLGCRHVPGRLLGLLVTWITSTRLEHSIRPILELHSGRTGTVSAICGCNRPSQSKRLCSLCHLSVVKYETAVSEVVYYNICMQWWNLDACDGEMTHHVNWWLRDDKSLAYKTISKCIFRVHNVSQ